jgi:hypothetical protein
MMEYFAKKKSKEMVAHVEGLTGAWSSMLGTTRDGVGAVWFRNISYYYSNFLRGTGIDSSLEFAGKQGELVKMGVPQARSLTQQFVSLVTKQKLHMEPVAISEDFNTVADTKVASALCESVIHKEDVDMKSTKMCEHGMLCGFGYMSSTWNMMKGKAITADEGGKLVMTGATQIKNHLPTSVWCDYTNENFYDNDWVVVQDVANRYDLLALYPDLENEIKGLQSVNKHVDGLMFWGKQFSEDYVFTYEFFHRSTPALPQGRYCFFSNQGTVYVDPPSGNPYKDPEGNAYIPVVQFKPEPVIGTGFGYPKFCDVLPMQEMLDFNFSAIASNNQANAVQAIMNPIGNDVSVKNLGGLRFINYKPMQVPGGGAPAPLQLTQSSPESYKFSDMLRSYMMEVMNINGALRGSPPPGVTAGNAIATLTTNAIEFTQTFAKAYVSTVEKLLTFTMWGVRNFAKYEDVVEIVGENEATSAQKFIGEDFKNISRVRCQIANPLMATAAGRFEVAQQFLKTGMITSPQKYFRVIDGAPVKTLYKDEVSDEDLIQKENDDLRASKQVMALFIDNHALHKKCHAKLLADPEVRRNAKWMQLVLDHIDEHDMFAASQQPNGMLPPGGMDPNAAPQMPQPGMPQGADPAEPVADISQMPMGTPMGPTGGPQ